MLESALDVPVVAFALPGYAADHPFYADAPRLVGECIARLGLPGPGRPVERQR